MSFWTNEDMNAAMEESSEGTLNLTLSGESDEDEDDEGDYDEESVDSQEIRDCIEEEEANQAIEPGLKQPRPAIGFDSDSDDEGEHEHGNVVEDEAEEKVEEQDEVALQYSSFWKSLFQVV